MFNLIPDTSKPMIDAAYLYDLVDIARGEKRMTWPEVAEVLGIHASQFLVWESGSIGRMDAHIFLRALLFTGIDDASYLIKDYA